MPTFDYNKVSDTLRRIRELYTTTPQDHSRPARWSWVLPASLRALLFEQPRRWRALRLR
jgi:hypothetical protein